MAQSSSCLFVEVFISSKRRSCQTDRLVLMSERRPYNSPLRERHAQATREQILEGVARSLARGVAGFSVSAVAREAGVSLATVYRYFDSKDALVQGLGVYIEEKLRLDHLAHPRSPAELVERLG